MLRSKTSEEIALVSDQPSTAPPDEYDVLVIGTGATGLVAALRAHANGLRPLLIEKSTHLGGATALSGGGVWIPNNHLSQHAGVVDSIPNALTYLETIVGDDVGPASSRERKMAFLTEGPKMVKWLEGEGFKWVHSTGYPDYYVESEGGSIGRTIEGKVFDLKQLKDWKGLLLRRKASKSLAMYSYEYRHMMLFKRTWAALGGFWKIIFRTFFSKLLRQEPITSGGSLAGQLLLLVKERRIPVWTQCPMLRLDTANGKVEGVVVMKGEETFVRARRGVLLCAGGFARNLPMRERFVTGPTSDRWTSVPPGDMGDAIQAGQDAGGAVALMDDAWWVPTFLNPATGEAHFSLIERSLPHSIIVDSDGQRFMNESQSYVDCGHAQYRRHEITPAIPAWFIFGSQHRNKYCLLKYPPGKLPEDLITSGLVTQANTLTELADKIKVDRQSLILTVQRFNAMAAVGVDEDFNRGGTVYDQFFGDSSCKPNPNLGSLTESPFYAIRVWPGDLGTKGGLVTNECSQVLRNDGTPIHGLYAAGNSSASVMGRTYPGAGGTLGPAMTFGYIAMDHLAADV